MNGSKVNRLTTRASVGSLAGMQNKGGAKMQWDIDTQGGPDQSTVAGMVRSAVGPKLEEIQQSSLGAKEAVRLHELAKWAGDHETADLLDQALSGLRIAARPKAA